MPIVELKPKKKSTFKKIRKGRGNASGKGGESGRGHKGQKSRSGYSKRAGFEGGQMPLYKRLPKKRGFNNNAFKEVFDIVNLSQVEKEFKENDEVNLESLFTKNLVTGNNKIKILGNGELTKSMTIVANAFSKAAILKIEKAKSTYKVI